MIRRHHINNMRALMYDRIAGTLELADARPVPRPRLENDEHVLQVHSIAITKGELQWAFPPEAYTDYSPGVEMSGEVLSSPIGSKFLAGTKIYMRTTSPRSGSAREYTIGLGSELALMPRNLSFEQAASVPVSALTAWQALFVQAGYSPTFDKWRSRIPLGERKKILIVGASGSVGIWATQLARIAGFWIVGICHTRNTVMVHSLGAHAVVDYTKTTLNQWLESNSAVGTFDLVLDCVGDGTSIDIWRAAQPDHGLVLSIVPPADMVFKWNLERPNGISSNVQGRFFIMNSDGAQLQKITELVEAGRVKPVVDSIFELDDYEKAFQRVDSGQTTGKVVVRVQKSEP